MNPALKEKLEFYRASVESGIHRLLPPKETRPTQLHTAMRYSMKSGGKRIRPALLYASSELFERSTDPTAAGVAVECLHTYTLIHDDLPAIDDSNLRRGHPSCHAQFDEATAILAGDALLTHAFQILADEYKDHPRLAIRLIQELAQAGGSERLIAGQMEDIQNEGKTFDPDTLLYIHENKTSSLLTAALKMGLFFCAPNELQLQQTQEAGHHLGLAFQIVDDILDASSDSETIGKPAGNDLTAQKSTYVSLYGIEGARKEAATHTNAAIEALKRLGGHNETLLQLVLEMKNRIN